MPDATEAAPKTLFEVTQEHLNTGLRGYPVGTCRTSAVSPELGVTYVGYTLRDLQDLPAEDVIFLLLNKELPGEDQREALKAEMGKRSDVDPRVFDALRALPKDGHPMEWLISGLSIMGMTGKSPDNDYREDCLNLIARISTLVAAIYRIREGWGDPIEPRHDLPLHENFVHMLGIEDASPVLSELLRLFYVLHMDHGGGNLSTFVGKAIASGKADMYSSIAGAMAALYGPRHGRANQECLAFVKSIGTAEPEAAEARVRDILASGGLVFGFGHAVLRQEDPRADIQYTFGEKHFPDHELVRTALALRKVVPGVLGENPKIQNPYPNVDAISGSLLTAAGLTDPEYYTLLFGWSRVAGIATQILDERTYPGKKDGLPIYRPKYVAEGQTPRTR
ncbi:MAG: citrate (Si)-synthase [Planctomycetota bacterium]|nr:citrate (Si)-synthase [Planctomycetota bacterium]